MTEKRNINYYAVDGLIMQGEHVDVNVPIKIALDHGWSSIKGEHIFMENLVTQVDYTPLTNNGLLEYRGRKYIIGQGRLGKQATKTENDNYFLLTLAGIAKELNYHKREKTTHVELYAGVPLTMFGAERKAFREYLWHKEQLSFNFEGVHYCFYLDKVKIYAQCYAAIANRIGDMNRLRCVDLGSWTMDVLSVKDKVPIDKDAYTYEVGLITAFERIKKDGLPKVHCEIPEEDITDYIKGISVNDEFIPIIEKGLQEYADNVEAKLREIKVDLKHENIIYVGGGASVMKKFGRTKGRNIQYVTDVKANAAEEGGQTALLKSALVSVIHDNKEADYYLKMQYEIQKAISKENEIFSDTVKEVMQSMVNQMFASSLAMIGQTQNPLQVTYPQQLYSSETALNFISSVTEKTQAAEVKDLEADNCKSMDDDTRNALGSLFDDED